MAIDIYLMRHGEVDKHPELEYTIDALNVDGTNQTLKIAKELFLRDIDSIISSPFKRTIQTAQLISDEIGIEVKLDPDFTELSRGIYTERPYEEFLEVWKGYNFDFDYVPPEGESVNQGRRRIVRGISNLINSGLNKLLIVTHAGVISNLLMMLYDFDFEYGKPNYGGLCRIHYSGNVFKLVSAESQYLQLNEDQSADSSKLIQ